jgi:peptidoglycan/LPS O-acetylase OafA/YrhL
MEIVKYLRAQWDRAIGIAALAAGVLALILGYLGVSGTPHVADQLPYFISGGLVGVFMLGVASTMWLSADLRDEWRELHALREALDRNRGAMTNEADGSLEFSEMSAVESVGQR